MTERPPQPFRVDAAAVEPLDRLQLKPVRLEAAHQGARPRCNRIGSNSSGKSVADNGSVNALDTANAALAALNGRSDAERAGPQS